jgi:hypothetical protein
MHGHCLDDGAETASLTRHSNCEKRPWEPLILEPNGSVVVLRFAERNHLRLATIRCYLKSE